MSDLEKLLAEMDTAAKGDLAAQLMSVGEVRDHALGKINAIQKVLITQEEVDKHIIPARLANTIKAKDHAEVVTERDRLKAEVEKIKKAPPPKDTDIEKLKAEWLKDSQAQIDGLKEMVETEKKLRLEVEAKRKEDSFQSALESDLVKLQVKPELARQAAFLARSELPHLDYHEANGESQVVAIDPRTKLPLETATVLGAWVEQNKHFVQPKPPGGGSDSAGPGQPPPPKDILDGKQAGVSQVSAALNAGFRGSGQVPPQGGTGE